MWLDVLPDLSDGEEGDEALGVLVEDIADLPAACGTVSRSKGQTCVGPPTFVALGRAWDRQHRCLGDHVHVKPEAHHPDCWDEASCVRIAFSSISASLPHHARETSHTLDAMAATALASVEAQASFLGTWHARQQMHDVAAIFRGFDSTPHDVELGYVLTEELMSIVKYR